MDLENENLTSEEETVSEAESADETPTTSDEDFIVSDSEMEEVEAEDSIEDQLELLFESFVNLQEENKILKKELEKQGSLLFEICKDLKKTPPLWSGRKAPSEAQRGSEAVHEYECQTFIFFDAPAVVRAAFLHHSAESKNWICRDILSI